MATATTTTLAATSSFGVTATVPASGPSPSSRPSATRSPSNPPPNTRGFSFQDSNAPGVRCSREQRRGGSSGVVADVAKLAVGREDYYTRELAADHEAYLSGHGESPGRWYGQAAAALGMEGEASGAGFRRMFEGRHPTTGELLGRAHGRNAVPAFDVVLRPTKSVSLLYGLGDPTIGRAVLAAHHAGVAEAVAYLDQHIGTRRGHGGVQHVSGQGLLAVGFDHRTSREGIRCCTPTWWWPTGRRVRTGAGRPWTAATSIDIDWPPTPSTAPATSANSPGRWGWSGRRPTATATGSSRACPRSW